MGVCSVCKGSGFIFDEGMAKPPSGGASRGFGLGLIAIGFIVITLSGFFPQVLGWTSSYEQKQEPLRFVLSWYHHVLLAAHTVFGWVSDPISRIASAHFSDDSAWNAGIKIAIFVGLFYLIAWLFEAVTKRYPKTCGIITGIAWLALVGPLIGLLIWFIGSAV